MKRSFDTETHGLDWFEPDQGPFLATWSDERGNDHLAHVTDKRAMAAFYSDMKRSSLICAHNLPFDVHQVREHCGIDMLKLGVPLVCTDLLGRVVLPERRLKAEDDEEGYTRGFKLEDLSKTYLPEEEQKIDLDALAKKAGIKLKETGGYYEFWRAYPDQFEDYARRDTRSALGLLPHLQAKLKEARNSEVWQLEKTVQPHLIRAAAQGVHVDQAKVEPLEVEYLKRQAEAYDAVIKVLGTEAVGDPNDPEDKDDHQALREALLSHGVPLYRKVKSCKHGDANCDCALATNKFALKEFERDYPVIGDLFKLRTSSKFLATYINPMLGREVVHPSFWQIGAWTGRMSCSRPNMQNIPVRGEGASELRAMFIPPPGYCFVVSDYDAIEARLLAYYLGTRGITYREMIQSGHDVHSWMASMIWGGSPAEYAKGGPKDKLRSMAKNVLFAIVYGAGAPRVMDMLADAGMPSSKGNAQSLIKAIKDSVPGYKHLSKRVRNKVEHYGYVNTIDGRRQPVKKDKSYVGLNAVIQGSAAGIFKQGIINVAEAIAPLGALPVLFVHDEIGSICPIEHAEECRVLQEMAMVAAWDLDPTLEVTSHICMNNYSEGK